MKIGHEIAKLRAQKNISQRELASALNVSAGWPMGNRQKITFL